MHVKGNIDSEKKELNSSHVLALTAEHGHFIQRSWMMFILYLLVMSVKPLQTIQCVKES